ncbi:hypothetical protein ACNOYE_32470 [Nannocystaceae bacterium ST9]
MTFRTRRLDRFAFLTSAALLVACADDQNDDDELGDESETATQTETDTASEGDPDESGTTLGGEGTDTESGAESTQSSTDSSDASSTQSSTDTESSTDSSDASSTESSDSTDTGPLDGSSESSSSDSGTDTDLSECVEDELQAPLPITVMGDNAGKGDDSQGCVESFGGLDVAYGFVAPSDGTYVIDTFGSSFDTVLYVEDGLCIPTPPLDCNDDFEAVQSQVQVVLTAGQEVTIHVDGFSNEDVGAFTLNIDHFGCPLATDIGMALPTTEMGVFDAGPGDIMGSCGGDGNELLFAWTAPAAGSYVFDTFGSAFDTVLYLQEPALQDGVCGAELACNDDADDVQSQVFADLAAGQTVIIVLDAFGFDSGGGYVINIAAN